MYRVMLPADLQHLSFDDTLYKKTVKFLKENDPKMIYIYGGDDPWTASGVTWLEEKENIKVYTLPGAVTAHVSAASIKNTRRDHDTHKPVVKRVDFLHRRSRQI